MTIKITHPKIREIAFLFSLDETRSLTERGDRWICFKDDPLLERGQTAKRQPSVRVVEAPRVPDKPQPIRTVILAVGAIAGLLLSIIVSLMSGFFRGVYLRPEALEVDTGLAVLAVVPDQKSLASPVVLVTPR